MGKLNFSEIKKNAIEIIEPDFSYIDGKYLRKFRMEMKMSQSLLADYLGVSKKAIEKWEQGKNKMNPLVSRMIYIIEHDANVLSLLKQIKVGSEVFIFKPIISFEATQINNDSSIPAVNSKYESIPFDKSNWSVDNKRTKGGMNYGTATI